MQKYKTKKRFGQHFLHDQGVIQKLVHEINPLPSDRIVEIGPGLGALTFPLLEKLDVLNVVEIDRDVIQRLRLKNISNLVIHEQDALNFEFDQLVGPSGLRVVGNLPYNISTPLIFHLLESAATIKDMHFMLQNEVVERITAVPGNKTYGRLSVMVQYYCETEYLFFVAPESFSPPPKVDSAILRLIPRKAFSVKANSEKNLGRLVTQSFSMRRKTLRNNLKKLISAEQIEGLGIDPSARAETLRVEDFVKLSNLLDED
ncbi:MAG: 16S rRNA (adenine(1518)-N(6)/adenine(1519)-N(6))-dimethyltransferase RsmA [Cocleimonas sp.]